MGPVKHAEKNCLFPECAVESVQEGFNQQIVGVHLQIEGVSARISDLVESVNKTSDRLNDQSERLEGLGTKLHEIALIVSDTKVLTAELVNLRKDMDKTERQCGAKFTVIFNKFDKVDEAMKSHIKKTELDPTQVLTRPELLTALKVWGGSITVVVAILTFVLHLIFNYSPVLHSVVKESFK